MVRTAARNRRQVMVHGDGRDTATYLFSSFGFFLSDDGDGAELCETPLAAFMNFCGARYGIPLGSRFMPSFAMPFAT